jgi:hypothetical protein
VYAMHLTRIKVADSQLLLSHWHVSIKTRRVMLSAHFRKENASQGSFAFANLAYRSTTDLYTKGAKMVKGRGDPSTNPPKLVRVF